mgnify:CR=1 FL=1
MATKTGGGVQHLSVQESKNIQLGQLGHMTTNEGSNQITPPDGTVFIAITMLYGGAQLNILTAEDPDRYINTAQASSGGGGTGGKTLANDIEFPAGQTIYGRWTAIDVEGGAEGVIAYIGV